MSETVLESFHSWYDLEVSSRVQQKHVEKHEDRMFWLMTKIEQAIVWNMERRLRVGLYIWISSWRYNGAQPWIHL